MVAHAQHQVGFFKRWNAENITYFLQTSNFYMLYKGGSIWRREGSFRNLKQWTPFLPRWCVLRWNYYGHEYFWALLLKRLTLRRADDVYWAQVANLLVRVTIGSMRPRRARSDRDACSPGASVIGQKKRRCILRSVPVLWFSFVLPSPHFLLYTVFLGRYWGAKLAAYWMDVNHGKRDGLTEIRLFCRHSCAFC